MSSKAVLLVQQEISRCNGLHHDTPVHAQGLCYLLLTVLGSITSLVTVALIFGLNNGGTITSMPVLLADHLGDQHLPITYGMHRLTMGVSTLARPLLIGESGWPV